MRAARWHGRNDVRVETVPDPTPGPGDVVIRIGYCGVCGTDLEEYRHGPIWSVSRLRWPGTIWKVRGAMATL